MLVASALPMPFKKSTRSSVGSSVSVMMLIDEVAGACAGIGCGFGSTRVVLATSGASPVGASCAGAAGVGAALGVEVWAAAGVTGVPVACDVSVGL